MSNPKHDPDLVERLADYIWRETYTPCSGYSVNDACRQVAIGVLDAVLSWNAEHAGPSKGAEEHAHSVDLNDICSCGETAKELIHRMESFRAGGLYYVFGID